MIASRNTGILTCCLVERRAPRESVERKAPGDAGVKPVKRKRSSRTAAADKLGTSAGIQEVEHGGWHCVPTVKPE